jgi:thiamine-phosphate pyrophosphorylase
VLRCAITDASRFTDRAARRTALLADAARWAEQDIDFVQLREKNLAAGELYDLAAEMLLVFRERCGRTRLLVNGRVDVALAAGADGVHLTSRADELTPAQVREVFARVNRPLPIMAISCHTLEEVTQARRAQVDLILFGPVFEKRVHGVPVREGCGIEALRAACASTTAPVLALGGVGAGSVEACLRAGAAGVAAIRMFTL